MKTRNSSSCIASLAFMLILCCNITFADSKTDDSIKIGVLASLSGNWAALGDMTRMGLMLASERINAHGGVLGKKISLVYQDTDEAVSPAKTVSAYQFLRSQGIKLFIGPTGSPGGIALAPIASRDGIIMITPSVGVKDFHLAGDNLFNVQGVWEYASTLLARFAFDSGVRSIAILASQHPFEVRQGDAFSEAFKAAGGKMVIRIDPLPTETDLRAELRKVVAAQPPAIFFANYNQMGMAARQLRELRYSGKQFATLVDESRLVDAAGSLNQTYFTRLTETPSEKFVDDFAKRFGKSPSYPADFAFDALEALASGIASANSTDPSLVKREISKVLFEGASGEIRFDKEGCVIRKPSVWQVESDHFSYVGALEPANSKTQ